MDVLFPEKLPRVQYFIRWLIWIVMVPVIAALLLPMPKYFGVPQWLIFSILFSLVLLRVPCADIPRFRSIGWSPWLALLLIIPVVGFVVQLLLFFLPGKESNN